MNNEFIKKYNLDEAVKRFKQINEYKTSEGVRLDEYTFQTGLMNEVGEDDQNQQNNPMGGNQNAMGSADAGGQPPMGGNATDMNGGQPSMGGDQNAMGSADAGGQDPMGGGAPDMNGDPNAMGGGQDPMGGDSNAINGEEDPMSGDTTDMGGEEDPMSEDPMADEEVSDEDAMGDVRPIQDDDEVIDVDDLTDSQEATEYKVDDVSTQLSDMLKVIDQLTKAVDDSNRKAEDFQKEVKAEMQNRMPSHQEKINIRTLASKPYNVNPNEYWEEQAKENPYYNVVADNSENGEKPKEYILKKSDLNNISDHEIDKSFDDIPKDLMEYF